MASASQQASPSVTTRPTSGSQLASEATSAQTTTSSALAPPPQAAPKGPVNTKQTPAFTFQAPALTGAAAMAEQKAREEARSPHHGQTSPNPALNAMRSLQSPSQNISSPSDAPPPTQTMTNAATASPAPVTAEPMEIDGNSPKNSRPHPDSVTDPRLTAPEANSSSTLAVPQERSNKAFSYPPRADQIEASNATSRSMTLPGSSSRSTGAKKHRCHHCGTEFTRHHNLKSHLLTHSQEKPFECDHANCDQKFRRLHDLKRHTKLHTGERPHTCNKCGRAFARGDALARHNKGPGGCAGRRGSGGEDDFDDDEGVDAEYNENSESVAKRRKSEQPLHSRKRSLNAMAEGQNVKQHSMTYPGPGVALLGSQQHPPANGSMSTNTHLSPRMNSTNAPYSPGGHPSQSVFAQGGMTESPRPLSPGAEQARRLSAALPSVGRARSPSLAQQLSRTSVVGSPAVGAMPGTASQTTLPSLGSIAPERPSSSLASSTGGSGPKPRIAPPIISTAQAINQAGPNSSSSTNPPSATSQHRSSGGSLREIINPGMSDDYMLKTDHEAMVRKMQDDMSAMHTRLQQLEAHLRRLDAENSQLRAAGPPRPSYPPPPPAQPQVPAEVVATTHQ